jgi:signal transduction histidine kinase
MDGQPSRELRASRRMLQVAEWEMQRILLDIHDGPVQYMYAALSQLDLLRRALEAPAMPPATDLLERVGRVRSLLEHGLTDVRSFIGGLRSPVFEARDLGTLLRELALQHEANTDTEVELRAGTLPDVQLPIRIALYRVLQEALWNAYRHGGARRVDVDVHPSADGHRIHLEVRDDGAGFDPARLVAGRHFGLDGMRDRVELIGGEFSIASAQGRGTHIAVTVPIA